MRIDQTLAVTFGAIGTLICLYLLVRYGRYARRRIRNLGICLAMTAVVQFELIFLIITYVSSDHKLVSVSVFLISFLSLLDNALFAHILFLISLRSQSHLRMALAVYIIPAVALLLSPIIYANIVEYTSVDPSMISAAARLQTGPISMMLGYSSTLALIASFVISVFVAKRALFTRKVIALIVLAMFIPSISMGAEMVMSNFIKLNFGLSAFMVVFSAAIINYIYLGYLNIARNRAIEVMSDGYLLFDKAERLTDINARAKQIFPNARLGDWDYQSLAGALRLRSFSGIQDFDGCEVTTEVNGESHSFVLNTFNISDSILQYCGDGLVLRETTEYRRHISDLEIMATIDPLTGSKNRRDLVENLSGIVQTTAGEHSYLTLLMLDIDHFKLINDSHGHAVGDVALKRVAELCMAALRKHDEFYRYGGEEFLVICVGLDKMHSQSLAERLRQRVETATIPVGDQEIKLTISIGGFAERIWLSEGEGAQQLGEQCLKIADDNLFRAKRDGRNRVVF